jgi:menaquinone-dependent protoporphyrinogen oxidase
LRVLVAYASRYGSTAGIAERIAAKLQAEGLDAEAKPVKSARDIDGYGAFVIGSAAFIGSWMKEASDFVRRNRSLLSGRPVWLFSSGPVGTKTTDAQGRDVREASVPKEIAEFADLMPRDHRVFFGALDRKKLTGAHRLMSLVPASKTIMIEGDFRDWGEIEAWAAMIAHELAGVPVGRH